MKRHWHPSPAQTLLLHAALDRGGSAVAAWNAWKSGGGDIQTLDVRSFHLLPLIAKNLVANGVPEPELGRLRGVRRRAWVEHINLVRRLVPHAGALVAAGLPVVFLKGVVLAPVYYGELGLRMLSDVDVLVRRADVPRAIGILARHGLRPHTHYPRSLAPALAGEVNLADEGFQHSVPFGTADGLEIDLHWSVMCSNVGPHSDEGMWARVMPFSIGGVDGLTLAATDHLLHVIVHGLSFSDTSTVRWIIDAMAILRSPRPEHGIDWKLLLDEVTRRGLVLPVAEALDYLVAELAAPVPAWVRAQLASVRPTLMDRLRYAELLQDWSEVRHPATMFAGVARFTEGRPPLEALRIATRYFVHRADLRSPGHAASQVALSLSALLPSPWRDSVRGWVLSRRGRQGRG